MICNQIDCSTRSFIDCREPVNPFGHCCPICGGIITLDFDSNFIFNDMKDFVDGKTFKIWLSYFEIPVRLDNIRTDYPSNQLFYSINRIPRTEENYDPGTWVMTLHLNDFKGFKTFHLIKVPFIVLIYHFRAWNICSDCKQLFSKPIFKSKIWTRSDSTSCCWYWWNRQRSKNWSWQIEKRNRGSLQSRIFIC